jgi:hypothetical protein
MKQPFARRLMLLVAVPLVTLVTACDRHPHEPHGHPGMSRVEIIDRGQTERPVVATWTPAGGWQGELPAISLATQNQRISLGARIYDEHNHEMTLSRTGEHSVLWVRTPRPAS